MTETWFENRLTALHQLMARTDYHGYDPFDLLEAPLCKLLVRGHLPRLVVSRIGSRFAPMWVRKLLAVPRQLDPKTLACAYFGYALCPPDRFPGRAREMVDRLAALTGDRQPTWGYPFVWPTRADGENPAGASTLVPTSFAMFALTAATRRGEGDYREVLVRAAEFIVRDHNRENQNGPFLGYFTHSTTNTHNANLLGCLAVALAARLADRTEWLEVTRSAAATSVAAVTGDGFLPYHDAAGGDWTDCFHHIYAIAALRAYRRCDPAADFIDDDLLERMHEYLDQTFAREDQTVDYYPGRRFPIDCHNGAATALYALTRREGTLNRDRAEPLLRAFDFMTWLPRRGHYAHRLWRRFHDHRLFLRWNQAWMFWALAAIAHPERFDELLDTFLP